MTYIFGVHPELEPTKNIDVYTKTVPFFDKLYRSLRNASRKLVNNAWSDPDVRVLEACPISIRNPFVATCAMAFAFHLPLKLRVEHFWLAFVQSLAMHVDIHSEDLRHLFVEFQGKAELVVDVTTRVLDQMTQKEWAEVVMEFSDQIEQHTKKGVTRSLWKMFQ